MIFKQRSTVDFRLGHAAILAGLKNGWAFAWRMLIAAELVFGATRGRGGMGWYIFQNRNELYTDKVFAGLPVWRW